MKLAIALILPILFLSSCIAYQSGGMSSNANGANYVYEDLAFGEARSDRFLWIGGLRKDALILEAKRDLISARPLKMNEEYINFTYDFKNSLILGFTRTKVSISADIIRYTQETPTDRYSDRYKDKLFRINVLDSVFSVGDSIYTDNNMAGVILSNISDSRSRVLLTNSYGEIISKRMNNKSLFNKKGSWNGLVHGDIIQYHDDMESLVMSGILMGFGEKELLIRSRSGEILRPLKKSVTLITDS